MRFHQSVEWGLAVSKIYHQLPSSTTLLLPELPNVITPNLREQFGRTKNHPKVSTLAINRHTPSSWLHHFECQLQQKQQQSDDHPHFLIVGGNDKPTHGGGTLSTPQAIALIQNHHFGGTTLWAVANPNDPSSVDAAWRKVEAGASGLVTQPLLTVPARDTILERYPKNTHDDVAILAGLALPKTVQGLLFWATLLDGKTPDTCRSSSSSLLLWKDDPLFQQHVSHFRQATTTTVSLEWAQSQHNMLLDLVVDGSIAGIHYMPLSNTRDLLELILTK